MNLYDWLAGFLVGGALVNVIWINTQLNRAQRQLAQTLDRLSRSREGQ